MYGGIVGKIPDLCLPARPQRRSPSYRVGRIRGCWLRSVQSQGAIVSKGFTSANASEPLTR